MKAQPKVAIIVPARNAEATLSRTLEAVTAQDGPGYELIVVDDRSTDRTAEIAAQAGARVVEGPAGGPGAARNAGVAATRAPLLAFLDADCFPAQGWLRAGVGALADADLIQGRVEPEAGVAHNYFDRSVSVTRLSPLFEAANLFVRRELFEALGGFEDWLGLETGKGLGEDTLFGWSARRRGAAIGFEPAAFVEHAVFGRGALGYALERRRLVHFPALVARIPELRRTLCFGRLFLTGRGAALDLALAGLLAAGHRRRSFALAAVLPYLLLVAGRAGRFGRHAPRIAAGELAADLTGLAALLEGSVRHRSPLL